MEFGLFAEQTRRGASQEEAFREMFALADASEAWGLDVFWLAEMLVNPARSVLSAPLLVASWIAARVIVISPRLKGCPVPPMRPRTMASPVCITTVSDG